MKKMITVLAALLILVCTLPARATDKRITTINDIKKNREYLYGEATMPTLEEATSLAYELLQKEVFDWAFDHMNRPTENFSVKDVNKLADTIVTRRADMWRVFAYIKKNATEQPTIQHPSPNNQHPLPNTQQPPAIDHIRKARNFFDLKNILPQLKQEGLISNYGKLATAEHLEDCHLIIYDAAGNIKALLGKGEETRPNLNTGTDDTLDNYRGCGALWVLIE